MELISMFHIVIIALHCTLMEEEERVSLSKLNYKIALNSQVNYLNIRDVKLPQGWEIADLKKFTELSLGVIQIRAIKT